jgi:enterochelin esterase-like enzyme
MPLQAFSEEVIKVFESELKQCVIPFIENNFRVKNETRYRALAGLSMGGIQTLYVGINNTAMFSYLGVFSSGWIQPMQNKTANAQYEFMKENAGLINSNLKEFWIAMGGQEDIAYKNCQAMLAKFDELKIRYTYSEYPEVIPGRYGETTCTILHNFYLNNLKHNVTSMMQQESTYFNT